MFVCLGWGCAYRTLQSIVSNLQYRQIGQLASPPSIDEIQRVLVDAGDKPPAFRGSRGWIGAIEVGLVLKALGVESRTLFVSSGREVAQNANLRALAQHFDTQSTIVMIGGGVLAYGLLGVCWREDTGDAQFLILDPHYTGAENIPSIIKGGWCAWHGPELFLSDHFYNFCLPIVK